MEDFERRQLAVKAYRLSGVSRLDWKRVMPKYGHQVKEWWIIPNPIWLLLIVGSGITLYFNWFFPWLQLGAFLISLYYAAQIGSRAGNIDGFQVGYEWGQSDGVCKALNINDSEKEELLKFGREVDIELEVGSYDTDIE